MKSNQALQYTEVGTVKAIRGCIILVKGFRNCINGQLIKFGYGTTGMIVGFNEQEAQVLILREMNVLKRGTRPSHLSSLSTFPSVRSSSDAL